MMNTLYIISEGRTESDFVKHVMADHLYQFGWITMPVTLTTGKNKAGVHKGGWRSTQGYQYAIQQIGKVVNTHKNAIYTTFFDFYGFLGDIPCYKKAASVSSPYEKVMIYEDQIKQDVEKFMSENGCHSQFIPYVQPFEFEALLFANTDATADLLANGNDKLACKLKTELKNILSQFETPEHINHGKTTAPSKRIESLVPGFVKNKAGLAGFSWKAAQEAGISNIRTSCIHFGKWLETLELYQ